MIPELLINTIPFKVLPQSLKESVGDKLLVSGVLQRADHTNQNGRSYPKDILEREASKYKTEYIEQRRAVGELDHPDSSVVNLKNVSHNIIDMAWKNDDLVGTIEILPTPSGNILKNLIRSNILLGISSRGLGSVKQDMYENTDVVQDDFELIAFDFVSNPSTQGAFMRPNNNLNESTTKGLTTPINTNIDRLIHNILSQI